MKVYNLEIELFAKSIVNILTCFNFVMLFCINSFAQTPSIPKPATVQPNMIIQGTQPNIYQPIISGYGTSVHEQNARIMQEVQQHQRQMQMNQRQMQGIDEEFEPRRGINLAVCKTVIPLPDFASQAGTKYFRNAFSEMNRMLTGEVSISLKDAVFLAENAYLGNSMSYKDYDNQIKEAVGLCRAKIRQQGLNPDDGDVKNMMLFYFMTDTFKLQLQGKERTLIHYPIKYDFEDFYARNDLRKSFVTKLMAENTGQCANMPMYYVIMAEELGAEAYLSRSPEHFFVKIKDNNGHWYNLELTSGAIINDNHYLISGFIKAEALRNRIYLEPMTRKETVAQIMAQMANYYVRQYGYDGFVKQCIDTTLKYYPNCLSAYMLLANYHTARAMYVIERAGMPPVEKLPECPQAYRLYQIMHQSYQMLDEMGYEDMPPDAYIDWLNRVNIEKEKPENRRNKLKLQQVIK